MARRILAALMIMAATFAGAIAQDSPEFGPRDGSEPVRDPRPTAEDLEVLRRMVDKGEVRAVIDRTYPLDQIVEAYTYVEGRHRRGAVVISPI